MAEEELLEQDEQENDQEEQAEEQEEFIPGELCPVDAVLDEDIVDLDDDGDFTREEKEGILKDLCQKAAQRDLTSYRLEVRDAWKARYFYRGNQFLLPGKNGAWILPQLVLMGGQSYDDHNKETNVYLAFADTITAALTAGTPSVRFEPDDPTNEADRTAAENSDGARRLIERANNMIVLQEDLARYLFTDGRTLVWTRYQIDGQRFGYEHESDLDDELSYLPELGGEAGASEAATDGTLDRGRPRGQETVDCFGALESKLPMQAKDLNACDYAQIAGEFDVTRMKTKYPDKAKEIEPMQSPSAETEYARLARTSIMMGMRPSNMTNDAMTYNTTETMSWFRPSFFQEQKDKTKREWLLKQFPNGARVAMVGTVVCEAVRESMNDHLTLIHSRPGDGMHRPANGSPLIPMQEKLNDCMEYVHDAFMHLIPLKWVDSEAIDTEALAQIDAKANQYLKMKRRPDAELASNIYVEPQIEIAEGLLVYIEKLFGEFSQFLVGAFPALFGGNTGSNDTASGIASQRDQALGRIGLTWRNIKAGYAQIIRQAVQCAAKFRNGTMSGEVPAAGGVKEHLRINSEDLKGNIRCYPDTDENFPESWVAQRAVWQQLMQAAEKNPVLGAILTVPRNLMIAKDKAGLPELVVPQAEAAAKQAGETMILLEGDPQPNPAIVQMEQALAAMVQANADPTAIAALGIQLKQLQQTTPFVSSVPIDEKLDDHANEMAEIKTFANKSDGIRAKLEKPEGFKNLRLHYDEHEAALAKQQAGKQGPPEKPVSESLSINFKDLPIDGQVQAAAKVGIQLDAGKMAAEEQNDKAVELATAAAKKAPPASAGATQ